MQCGDGANVSSRRRIRGQRPDNPGPGTEVLLAVLRGCAGDARAAKTALPLAMAFAEAAGAPAARRTAWEQLLGAGQLFKLQQQQETEAAAILASQQSSALAAPSVSVSRAESSEASAAADAASSPYKRMSNPTAAASSSAAGISVTGSSVTAPLDCLLSGLSDTASTTCVRDSSSSSISMCGDVPYRLTSTGSIVPTTVRSSSSGASTDCTSITSSSSMVTLVDYDMMIDGVASSSSSSAAAAYSASASAVASTTVGPRTTTTPHASAYTGELSDSASTVLPALNTSSVAMAISVNTSAASTTAAAAAAAMLSSLWSPSALAAPPASRPRAAAGTPSAGGLANGSIGLANGSIFSPGSGAAAAAVSSGGGGAVAATLRFRDPNETVTSMYIQSAMEGACAFAFSAGLPGASWCGSVVSADDEALVRAFADLSLPGSTLLSPTSAVPQRPTLSLLRHTSSSSLPVAAAPASVSASPASELAAATTVDAAAVSDTSVLALKQQQQQRAASSSKRALSIPLPSGEPPWRVPKQRETPWKQVEVSSAETTGNAVEAS